MDRYVKLEGYGAEWKVESLDGEHEPSRHETEEHIVVIGKFIQTGDDPRTGWVVDPEDGTYAVIHEGEFVRWRDGTTVYSNEVPRHLLGEE